MRARLFFFSFSTFQKGNNNSADQTALMQRLGGTLVFTGIKTRFHRNTPSNFHVDIIIIKISLQLISMSAFNTQSIQRNHIFSPLLLYARTLYLVDIESLCSIRTTEPNCRSFWFGAHVQ